MWYLLAMFLVRGGTMSEQYPTAVKPTDLPHTKPARTLADVEADLALAGTELNHHRSRRGELTNKAERIAQRPALMVHEVNWLLEEWATLHQAR